MKKLFLVPIFMIALGVISCSEDLQDEELVPKDLPIRWGPTSCFVVDATGTPQSLGAKCKYDQSGGCKWPTKCKAVSSSFVSFAIEHIPGLTEENWGDEVTLGGSYEVQLELWRMDPTTYEHPDSIK
jgi:hypothetical protein